MAEVLRWRLQKPDCDRGAVLDGLDSRYASAGEEALDSLDSHRASAEEGEGDPSTESGRKVAVTAKAVLAVMPGARLLVLRFKDDDKGYVARGCVL